MMINFRPSKTLVLVLLVVFSEGLTDDSSENEDSASRQKRSYDMSRLGRGLHMLRLGKRGLGMLRLGRASPYAGDSQENDLDWLYDYLQNEQLSHELGYDGAERQKRSVPEFDSSKPDEADLVKEQEEEEDEEKWMKDFLENEENTDDVENGLGDVGEDLDDEELKDLIEKRPMSMLRLGKRPMSMLRLGKRQLGMLRLGKRPMNMLRLGKRQLGMLRLGKRPVSMLRLGKRPMSMIRMGKRQLGMLRLGKRPMSMLRLGKRPMNMLRLGKRPMSMLRLGKRPMSMLRLGKRSDEQVDSKVENSPENNSS